jgi:Mrp family chromosome partitioning ATPase/LPS O-antigen subunit length determinant protein (WzzB/FepE family)
MTGYLGMDLPRFLGLLRARKWLIAAIVIAAAALAFGASLTQSDRYQASADLVFGKTTNADAIVSGTADTATDPVRAAATNLALASLDTVATRVKRRFRGSATVDEIRSAVSIHSQGESDVVSVTAEWSSPEQAAAIANAFATEIVAQRRETAQADIQRGIDALKARIPPAPASAAERTSAATLQGKVTELETLKALTTGNVHVAESATPPDHRSSPRPARNAIIAGFVAAILSLFLVVLLARFDDRIRDEDELAELMETSVLTRVPAVERSRRLTQVWTPHQDHAFLESFEFLRLNLQLMGRDGDSMVVAMTSPTANDGKTTVVSWLARALALSGDEVVAVDLDLRKPELHTYFNANREPGDGVLEALLSAATENGGPPTLEADDGDADVEDAHDDRPHGRRVYTSEDINIGLDELARLGGNARKAARSLKASGRDISESTLRRWKDIHAPLYAEIRAARTRGIIAAPHLRLLPGNHHPELPSGLIARGRLRHLFDELRMDADWVLVDTVPVSTVADASAVASAADGVILVIDLERVRRRDLLAAKKQLANARATILGIVLNRAVVDFPIYHAAEDEREPERGPVRAR